MKKSRFNDSQIKAVLKQAEVGTPVAELCREHGMSSGSFYKWYSRYGGMDASMMTRLKELEDENRRLKKMYAEERLKTDILQEAMAKPSRRKRMAQDAVRARRVSIIIHKSRETLCWLKANPKSMVFYQPVYSPWFNHVERLWQALQFP